jgi:hypothetical protein
MDETTTTKRVENCQGIFCTSWINAVEMQSESQIAQQQRTDTSRDLIETSFPMLRSEKSCTNTPLGIMDIRKPDETLFFAGIIFLKI